jgi:hypothetical protein
MTRSFKLAGLSCTCRLSDQRGIDESFRVILLNGRTFELCSKEGADDFVDAVGTDFISTCLTATRDKQLHPAYFLMSTLAHYGSPEKIASGIPESELRTFVEHMRDTLATLSTDRNWLRSGTMSACQEVLMGEAVRSFSVHPSFIKIFISKEGMEAVAKFYASRKKHDTPSYILAQCIVIIVKKVHVFLTDIEGATVEKGFSIIEKTGLLGQFIRCIPVDPECSGDPVAWLLQCLQLVKKKLKSGTPMGDILDAVIAGKDGPINEKAKADLTKLQSLARLSNQKLDNGSYYIKTCQHCAKRETPLDNAKLMTCQRCKVTYYCNRECQVADWKSHKKQCTVLSSGGESRSTSKTSIAAIWAFLKENYFAIAKEVYNKTQEYNVPKKELLVEIDFTEDAPALRNEFKVWLASGFLDGPPLVDAPHWFRTQADKKTFTRGLMEAYDQVTSDELRVVFVSGTMVKNLSVHLPVPNAGCLFSDEAVESIGRNITFGWLHALGNAPRPATLRERVAYQKRGTNLDGRWAKDPTEGHRMAKTKYDFSGKDN